MKKGNIENKDVPTKIRYTLSALRIPLTGLLVLALITTYHDLEYLWIGAAVALFGQAIQIWSCSHIYKQKFKNKVMAISGPYAHVRNPMYIGRGLVLMGPFIATGNLWLVLAYVMMFAAYAHSRVQREEKFLVKHFGPPYEAYCAEVPRWMPSLRRYSGADPRPGSWKQAVENREHVNLAAVLVFIAIAYVRIVYFGEFSWHILGP